MDRRVPTCLLSPAHRTQSLRGAAPAPADPWPPARLGLGGQAPGGVACWAGRPPPRGAPSWPRALLCSVHAEDMAWLPHAHGLLPRCPAQTGPGLVSTPCLAWQLAAAAHLISGGLTCLSPPLAPPTPGPALL